MAVKRSKNSESGQALLEYILLLSVIIGAYVIVFRGLREMKFGERLMRPLQENFTRAYRYGHPEAKGYDDGGPVKHPRAQGGEGSFRIFINPRGGV